MYICEVNYILTFKSRSYEKQITFLVLVILCLTSVEIYSSRQELKFDAPLPSNTENGNARSDYGPPGEGDKCWYFDGASSCVNFSFNNCYEDPNQSCGRDEGAPN